MAGEGLRVESSRALATAIAHRHAGNVQRAEVAALELVSILQRHGILPPDVNGAQVARAVRVAELVAELEAAR